jgi:predicted MPP superfamily phosphohydrolase
MSGQIRRAGLFLALNLFAGALLFAFMSWNESMTVPQWAEGVVHSLYNTVFGFTLPLQGLLHPFFPPRDHHALPIARLLGYGLTPLLVSTLTLAVLHIRRQRLAAHLAAPANDAPAAMGRRAFLIDSSSKVMLGGAAGFSGYSTWYEPWAFDVPRYDVKIQGLPASMDGYTIVQLSDTHYGPFVPLKHIQNAIRLANSLEPDFTVLTGDYVHRSERAIELGIPVFAALRAKHGVAAVLGNHDHWEDAEEIRRHFAALGTPMLDNTRTFLTASGRVDSTRPGEGICLAGVGDLWSDRVDVAGALDKVDPDVPRVVLSHNPDVAEDVGHRERIDLMLSGHTHGGQISVPFRGTIMVPSSYGRKYAGGWCKGPRHPVIVSRGIGMAVMPYRFRVRPEIVHITLRQARA